MATQMKNTSQYPKSFYCKTLAGVLFITSIIIIWAIPANLSASSDLLSEGLVAHWEFSARNGSVLFDKTGNGYSGTINGNTQWVSENERKTLYFDGKTTTVKITSLGALVQQETLSVSFRIKGGSFGSILGRWDTKTENRSYVITVGKDNLIRFAISSNGKMDGIHTVRGKTRLKQGKWYHCVAVADGDTLKIYLSGYNDSSALVTYDGTIFNGTAQLIIGYSPWMGKLKGSISDIRFYDRPLRPHDILALAGNVRAAKHLTPVEHLIYFSFSTPKYNDLSSEDLRIIQRSPYTGLCTRLIGAYETNTPRYEDYAKNIAEINRFKSNKVWPLVFFNRFIGSPEYDPCSRLMIKQTSLKGCAKKVNGMDLFDDEGSLSEFKAIYRLALKIAKQTKCPGIFIDPEAYNCYDCYRITELARRHKKTPEEIIRRLKQIGAEMADICNSVYPSAIIFFYIIDFGQNTLDDFQRSISYIAEGMLERAKSHEYSFIVVDGWTGQYLYYSFSHFKHIVETKLAKKASFINKYEHLAIAGVVAPFESYDKLPSNSWMKRTLRRNNLLGRLKIREISDFSQIYDYLFSNFKFVWIYGATQAGYPVGYDIFSPSLPDDYERVLVKSLRKLKKKQFCPVRNLIFKKN